MAQAANLQVNWKASIAGADIASGNDEATVQPAETHHIQFNSKHPTWSRKPTSRSRNRHHDRQRKHPCSAIQDRVNPKVAPQSPPRQMNNCVLLDNTGKTQDAFRKLGFNIQTLNPDQQLPDNITTVFVAELLLDDAVGKKAFADIAKKVNEGLNIVILAQSDKALASTFGFRAFTPGVRFVYPRASTKKIVMAGLDNTDLENWRGQTTLGEIRLRRNRSKSANGKNVSGDARHTESLHQRSSKSHTRSQSTTWQIQDSTSGTRHALKSDKTRVRSCSANSTWSIESVPNQSPIRSSRG